MRSLQNMLQLVGKDAVPSFLKYSTIARYFEAGICTCAAMQAQLLAVSVTLSHRKHVETRAQQNVANVTVEVHCVRVEVLSAHMALINPVVIESSWQGNESRQARASFCSTVRAAAQE